MLHHHEECEQCSKESEALETELKLLNHKLDLLLRYLVLTNHQENNTMSELSDALAALDTKITDKAAAVSAHLANIQAQLDAALAADTLDASTAAELKAAVATVQTLTAEVGAIDPTVEVPLPAPTPAPVDTTTGADPNAHPTDSTDPATPPAEGTQAPVQTA